MYDYTHFDPEKCEFVQVAAVDDLSDGERLFVEIGEQLTIVLFRIAGEYFAIEDVCTHDGGPLGEGDLEGYQVICPRHGAHFDVKTGKALSLPAMVDIGAYPVRIVDGQIEVGIPEEDE
jgi:3-phenylpropionate/trans-cinnamate dioxygenase ferredoxin subunit